MSQPAEIPASEVRSQISEVISRVAYGGERVVISRNGKAQVAVVPIADLDRLKKLDEQREVVARRGAEAIARMREHAVKTGLDKLTDEEIEAEIAEARKTRRRSSR
ncbi:MAG: type II toxin-antitoxin system Phd/YefM family antitoxin [Myxococcales bacterium]|nr:type II toxin-antitoxin system Phd/YefM family antitoxin [Myxococcales bacterium]